MKTYSRPPRRVFEEESRPAAKKRRVSSDGDKGEESEGNLECAIRESSAAILSSPAMRRRASTVFSSDVLDDEDDGDLSTPPSSPPETRPASPPANTRKPTFSFLKKRKRAAEKVSANAVPPLTEVNTNSVRTSTTSLNSSKKKAQQPTVLKQMQIDLGGDVRKTCSTCGMEYVPTNTEDVALHKKYHDMNSSGVDLGRAFVKANTTRWVYEAARFEEGYVVIVDRKSSATAKNQAIKVLEVVNKDLSSTNIPDTVLWSQTEPPKSAKKNKDEKEEIDRYRVFLHMKDSKCVGVCLTERIWESRPVKPPGEAGKGTEKWQLNSSSITVGRAVHPAVVGISRVWTSKSSRRKGIAMDLLDCVVSNYIYGIEIPKEQIAFSQPTESGCRLAESFFGQAYGWHVYNEE